MLAIEFGIFASQAFPALIGIVFSAAVGRLPLGMFVTGSHGVSFFIGNCQYI